MAVAVTMLFSGCATAPGTPLGEITKKFNETFASDDPCSNNARNIGIAAGTLGGAVVGTVATKNKKVGALVGAATGALIGGLIGYDIDRRRCELSKIAKQYQMELVSAPVKAATVASDAATVGDQPSDDTVGLDVQMGGIGQEFVAGTAKLTPRGREYLSKVADQYTPKTLEASLGDQAKDGKELIAQRQVLIVGHSDERDNVADATRASLSEARAKAVAEVFRERGVPEKSIAYQGAGDTLPIAASGAAGGARNNRVQVVDLPNAEALKTYASRRSVNPANFKVAQSANPRGAPTSSGADGRQPPVGVKNSARNASPADAAFVLLGGEPMGATDGRIDLGSAPEQSSFSFISSAHADAPVVIGPCHQDRPRVSLPIRSLADNRPIEEALPGLYGQPWTGERGNASVALLHVYAPSDAAAPVPPVTVEIYRREGGGYSPTPIASFKDAPVNVYRGANATLYRVFLRDATQCIDLRVPSRAAQAEGLIVYPKNGANYKANIKFSSQG